MDFDGIINSLYRYFNLVWDRGYLIYLVIAVGLIMLYLGLRMLARLLFG